MKGLLVHGGKIYTMDEKQPVIQNMYVEEGIVRHINVENIKDMIAEGVTEMDLEGRCLLPGLHDSHMHMLLYGMNKMEGVDLSEANSIKEMKECLKEYIENLGKSRGVGYWVTVGIMNGLQIKKCRLLRI